MPDPPPAALSSSFVALDKLEATAAVEHAQSSIDARFAPLADAMGAPYHVAIDRAPDGSADAVANAVVDRAAAIGASLVAMAAHSKGPLARFCVGSVTKHVVDRSPATVLVMRCGEHAGH